MYTSTERQAVALHCISRLCIWACLVGTVSYAVAEIDILAVAELIALSAAECCDCNMYHIRDTCLLSSCQ